MSHRPSETSASTPSRQPRPSAAVHLRPLQAASDYDALVAVHTGSLAHDQIDLQSAREGIPTAAELIATFPLEDLATAADLVIAEVAGTIVGYAHVRWRWTETSGERVYLHLGYILPAWRGQGIGTALLRWCQQRIAQIVRDEGSGGSIRLASNASSTEVETLALLHAHYYTVVRELSDMVAPLPADTGDLTLPADVELRPVTPDHHRAIYLAFKDAFSSSFLTTAIDDADYTTFVADHLAFDDFDPTLCHVAWIGEEVVGFTLCREHAGVGILDQVGVRPALQRRGIGRALLARSLQRFAERGFPAARLYTDAADGAGARSLYESVGFVEAKRHLLFRGALPQETVVS